MLSERVKRAYLQEITDELTKDNVNTKLSDGYTRLHKAAYLNFIEETKLLLELGANPNIEGCDFRTALSWAIQVEANQIAKLLIDKGADVNRGDNLFCTPLHIAWINENYEGGSILIKAGAEVTTDPLLPDDPEDIDQEHRDQVAEFLAFVEQCKALNSIDSTKKDSQTDNSNN